MSQFKKKLTALGAFLTFITLSSAAVYADGISGNTVINQTDNIRVTTDKDTQTVDLKSNAGNGAVGQVDWGRLNVGAGETLRFGFSGLSQTIINRVLGGSKSEFFGKILNGCTTGDCAANHASGKVVIINPAGMLFGAGSQVDLNSLTTSTFDFRGAKNLADLGGEGQMTQAQYLDSLRLGEGKTSGIRTNQETGKLERYEDNFKYNNSLIFDRNKTDNFDGITANHRIDVDGATFDHFGTGKNTNNTVAMVSDNIMYKNSLIKVGENLNYNKDTQSYGKVSLITADGVQFGYLANGAEKNHSAYAAMKAESATKEGAVNRNITIDNNAADGSNNVNAADRGIFGGDISIENRAMTSEGSDVNISNAVIRANKLESVENGDIYIIGTNKVNVKNSLLSTKNTSDETVKQYGGEIYINTLDDLNIENSQLRSAGSNYPDTVNVADKKAGIGNTGSIRLMSERGNATVNDSIVSSEGHVKVEGYNSVNINNSAIDANNVLNAADLKDVDILSTGNIKITNSLVGATNDVNILSSATTINNVITNYDLANGGNVTINSEYGEGDDATKNLSFVKAGNNLNIRSKDTTVDNATLAYSDISFYDEAKENDANNIANVTIKNNTAFDPNGTEDITLKTNGDFTFDHATAKLARGTEIVIGKDIDNTYGKLSAAASATYDNADNITVHANGDLTVKNASDITTKNGDITLTTYKNATVDNSKLTTTGGKITNVPTGKYEQKPIYDKQRPVLDENGDFMYDEDGNMIMTRDIIGYEDDLTKPIYETIVSGGSINISTIGEDDASIGKLSVINGSNLNAVGDVNLSARDGLTGSNGDVLVQSSNITAGVNLNVVANNDINILNNPTVDGLDTIENESRLKAGRDVSFTANNDVTIKGSEVRADRNATIAAGNDVTISGYDSIELEDEDGVSRFAGVYTAGDATITAGNDVKVTNFGTVNSDLGEDNVIEITANNNVVIDGYSTINGGKDVNITATTGDVSILASTVGGGSAESLSGAKGTVNITANNDVKIMGEDGFESTVISNGDVNITAQTGGLKIATADIEGDNVNVTSFKTIKFGNDLATDNILNDTKVVAKTDIKFTANGTDEAGVGNADIIAEKTNMAQLTYGNRLTFNASRDNKFTSENSLKSVNVDYIAGNENNFDVKTDIEFVNSTLNAPKNNVNAGNDVILNNLTIASATEQAKDTVTRITAGGDVTTVNVTNHGSETVHTYPNSVSTDRTGTEQTELDVNGTKLFVTTSSTVNPGDKADKGSVNLNLRNTSVDAGVEIIAENAGGWDKTIGYTNGVSNGPVVTISSADGNPVAVSKIITDKLNIVSGTDIIASEVAEITDGMKTILGTDFPADIANNPKGYLEVRDKGGFNQNPDPATEPVDGTFNYVKDYGTPTPDPDLDDVEWTKKHIISYDDKKDNFILIYDKARDCTTTPGIDPEPTTPTIDDRNEGNKLPFDPTDAQSFLRSRTAENHDLNRTALPRQLTGVSDKDQIGDGRGTYSSFAGAAALQPSEDGSFEIVTTRDIEKEEDITDSEDNNSSDNISFLNQQF